MTRFPPISLPSGRTLSFDRPLIMGVINVTPDSFSDGGQFLDHAAAVTQARALVDAGADLLDIGGESTRPGAAEVSAEEERERVAPVIAALSGAVGVPISVDTTKATVAAAALEAGAEIVNDVSALQFDPALGPLTAERGAALVLMHMRGTPRTMQRGTIEYDDVVGDIAAFLEARTADAEAQGVPRERILVDPGIGFGKTVDHNLEILRRLDELGRLNRPLVLGTSRKSFIGQVLDLPVAEREEGTLATVALGVFLGAAVVRVHAVRAARRVADMAHAVRRGSGE